MIICSTVLFVHWCFSVNATNLFNWHLALKLNVGSTCDLSKSYLIDDVMKYTSDNLKLPDWNPKEVLSALEDAILLPSRKGSKRALINPQGLFIQFDEKSK